MQIDWQNSITTLISAWALYVAFKAKNEAKKANEIAKENYKRSEANQYYPLLDFNIETNEKRIYLSINNLSNDKKTYIRKIQCHGDLKTSHGVLHTEESSEMNELLGQNTLKKFDIEKFNELLSLQSEMINMQPENKVIVELKIWVHSKPVLHTANTIKHYFNVNLSLIDKKLTLNHKPSPYESFDLN